MPKDSLTNSFIVKIKWVDNNLKIVLQNIHTREITELSTWPDLFKELISQPMDNVDNIDNVDNACSVTLSCEQLEHLSDTAPDVVSEHRYMFDHHNANRNDGYNDISDYDEEGNGLGTVINKIDATA